MSPDLSKLSSQLNALAFFADLHEDAVFEAFCKLIATASTTNTTDTHAKASLQTRKECAARFASLLYKAHTDNWTDYLDELVLGSTKTLAWFAAKDREIPFAMKTVCRTELEILQNAAEILPGDLGMEEVYWLAHKSDLENQYADRMDNLAKYGSGVFAKSSMFRLADETVLRLIPVANGDPVTFDVLYGYEDQHQRIIDNTKALLSGLPCSNLLLYGDAGTGKSASIKAVLNLFKNEGLRLVEVGRGQLALLPDLLDCLADEPSRFVVYIDDLSFGENDDSFSALKAVLEGGVCARSKNVVIYATSNRRHLVKESMSARTGDDMHKRDTLQETLSLSQRFGECIFFEKPNNDAFMELVDSLASEYGLHPESMEQLHIDASSYALAQGGRSARAARQFIEHLVAREGLNDVKS